jgi:hypothetical protein
MSKRTRSAHQSPERSNDKAEALAFAVGDELVFAKRVNVPAMTRPEAAPSLPARSCRTKRGRSPSPAAERRPFAKRVNLPAVTMPQRSYLRSSLAEMAEEITEGLGEAVTGALADT